MTSMTHVAGLVVNIGPHMRQRCAWCGAVMIDYDLTRIAVVVTDGEKPSGPPTWEVGALIVVAGNASWVAEDQGDDQLPADACARLDPEITV